MKKVNLNEQLYHFFFSEKNYCAVNILGIWQVVYNSEDYVFKVEECYAKPIDFTDSELLIEQEIRSRELKLPISWTYDLSKILDDVHTTSEAEIKLRNEATYLESLTLLGCELIKDRESNTFCLFIPLKPYSQNN